MNPAQKETLDTQVRFLISSVFIESSFINRNKKLYYITWDDDIYCHQGFGRLIGHMFFTSKRNARNALIKVVTNRCWGIFSNDRDEAIELIRKYILQKMADGTIKIEPVKLKDL